MALGLFEGYGVEIEYMIVDRETLSVLPVSDRLLEAAAGEVVQEVERGRAAWSNELVLHVLEMKTAGPAPSLGGLDAMFQAQVAEANRMLAPLGGRLMPGAMHPWMDPGTETRLWPHGSREIYDAFDRIFSCQGHGWSNLQSCHLNLPFHGDDEFGRLHAAIRLVLPILPALAASSPIVELAPTGLLDTRMDVYRTNARRIPSVTGNVIPEPAYTRTDYESAILAPIYADLEPFDPQGILREEWVNARGAIARFDRDTIEIRVLDVQECPAADLAILAACVSAVRALVGERWEGFERQSAHATGDLAAILAGTIAMGGEALISDADYLAQFGFPGRAATAGELWSHLVAETLASDEQDNVGPRAALETILHRGPLARRILTALDGDLSRSRIAEVYGELCRCLAEGRLFTGDTA